MTDDAEILRQYADHRSESAFSELVGRHVDLVYSVAFRRMGGDHHRAEEVTQMVFVDLARKARAVSGHPVLQAWLHRATFLASASVWRKESRRRKYEQASLVDAGIVGGSSEAIDWEKVRPVLDGALDSLDQADRQAILLRFFSNRSFGDVGRQMSLTENAARMRVERALDKLHGLLARRGVTSSAAALAAVLSGNSVIAAPSGVAALATSTAVAGTGNAAGLWISFMTTSKLPLSLTAVVLIGGTGALVFQEHASRRLAAEVADLASQNQAVSGLKAQNRSLALATDQARAAVDADTREITKVQDQVAELEVKAGKAAAVSRVNHYAALDGNAPIFDYKTLDVAPTPTFQVPPKYNKPLAMINASGEVVIDFVVGTDGSVYNVKAASSTQPDLVDPAVEAVSQWRFNPGQVKGAPVNTHMQVPIEFTFSPSPPPPPTAATWF